MFTPQQVKLLGAVACLLVLLTVVGQGGAPFLPPVGNVRRKGTVVVDIEGPPDMRQYVKTHDIEGLGKAVLGGMVEARVDPVGFLREVVKNVSTPKVIIAGPPAGGKGTQCEMLVKIFGFVHISTGDLLRSEVAANTPLGLSAQSFMTKGELVPDDVVIGMLLNRIRQDDVKERGWLLDGFPRTVNQARVMLQEAIRPDSIIVLDVPDSVVAERISGRRTDPETGTVYHVKYRPAPEAVRPRLVQRADDTPEAIKERLVQYHRNVNPLLTSFTCPIHRVAAGSLGPKDVLNLIIESVQAARWTALSEMMKR